MSKIKVIIKHTSRSGKVFLDALSLTLSETDAPLDLVPLPEFRGR